MLRRVAGWMITTDTDRKKALQAMVKEWIANGAVTKEHPFVPKEQVMLLRPTNFDAVLSLSPASGVSWNDLPKKPCEAYVHPETFNELSGGSSVQFAAIVCSIVADNDSQNF